MNISNESRLELKAAVTRALRKLENEFPLQARIEGAQPALQAAYAGMLDHWVREAAPPPAGIAPQVVVDTLCALDAIVFDEHGLGCYPFSARKTGIHVGFTDRSVHAMCAIDALAIPRIVRRASRITSRCAACRCDLACAVAADGSIEDNEGPEAASVVWSSGSSGGQACGRLCTGINFLCRHCTAPPGALIFSLPQAAAVGNAFFAFQRKLLDQYRM